MNKFFKRLALLLAVLMIVSMMPVQLFADNSVIVEGQSNGTTQNKAVASYELNGKTISFEGKTIREVNTKMREYWEVDDANGCSYNADRLPADGTGALTWTIYGTVGQGEYLNSGALILPALSGGYIYKDGTYQWKNITVVAGDENATIVSNDTFDVNHIYVSNGANATTTFTGITLDGSLYVVPKGTVTFDGCVFKGMLRVPNGKGFVKVANCRFVGDADEDSTGTKNEYPFFFQAGGTLEFIGNTIAANTYKRGLNVGGLTELNATIENNTIGAVTAGYSAIQLSGKVTEAKIKGNKISLDGTNAFTLHGSLISANKVTKVTVDGNTITGNGYLIYDDAAANNKAFTSENLKLTIGTNTVASTVDTKQGVKESNKYDLSTVVKDALTPTYVAKVNGVDYASLAEAIAAATPDANGVITYEISGKAEISGADQWISFVKNAEGVTAVKFVGMTADAEISITSSGSILGVQGVDVDVSFENLTLSHPNGAWVDDLGHATKYFTCMVRRDGHTVTYTNCTFPNGACNNMYGNTVFNGCKFTNATTGMYNFWNYGGNTEIKNSTFTGVRGIKTYNEGTLAVAPTVKIENTTFDGLTEKAAIVTSKATDITLDNVSATKCTKGFFQKAIEGSSDAQEIVVVPVGSNINGKFNVNGTIGVASAEEFNISAGTFTSEVSSDYLADGFELKKNIDGTYGVKTAGAVEVWTGFSGPKVASYETIAEAVANLGENNWIVITKDYTLTEDFVIPAGVYLDIEKGATLTVADGVTLTVAADCKRLGVREGAKLNNYGTVLVYGTSPYDGGKVVAFAGSTVDIDKLTVPTGYFLDNNAASYFASIAVFKITYSDGSTKPASAYTSWKNAVKVTLLTDVSDFARSSVNDVAENFVLDLDGFILSGTTTASNNVLGIDAPMTIINGTIKYVSSNTGSGALKTTADVTIDSTATIDGGVGYAIWTDGYDGHTLTVNGTVKSDGSYAITSNGSENGGRIAECNIIVNSGAVISAPNGIGIYHPELGTVTVNGGEITAHTGIEMCAGKLVVKGGKITSTGANWDATGSQNAILDGAAVSIINRNYPGGIPTAEISGGEFVATRDGAQTIKAYDYTNNTVAEWTNVSESVSVSGGTFSSIPANMDKLCAEGFIPTKNADGTWGIKVKPVATVGGVEYTTLAEAIAALNITNHTLTLIDARAWDEATPVYWQAGRQSGYAAKLTDALTAAYKANADDITIVCRPGADVGAMTHGHVADNLTVYGNKAYISGGECDLEVDTYMYSRETGKQVATGGVYLDKAITITAYELDNLGVWGQRHTDYTINISLNDCDGKAIGGKANVQRVYISGTTGVNNITVVGCDFLTKATALYSNADGETIIDKCSFAGSQVPVNFNHKANGTQTVTVKNSTFTNCGDNGDWKQFAAPVRFVNSGSGTSTATVDNCTFTETVGANGDILLGDGRNGEASFNVSVTVVNTAANVQIHQPGYYGADGSTTDANCEKTTVAKSDPPTTFFTVAVAEVTFTDGTTKKYSDIAEAIAAANAGDTVKLLANLTETDAANAHIVYDLTGKTLDLNGFTYSHNNFAHVFEGTGGTIKNGKMVCDNGSYALFIGDEGETTSFTVDGVEMVGGINIYNASGVVLKNLTVNGSNYYAVWLDEHAAATIESGTYNAGSKVVFNAFKLSSLTVTGGTINTNGMGLMGTSGGTLSVSGGTFDASVPEEYCADRYIPTQNEDGTYGVKEATKGSEKNPYTLEELGAMTRDQYIAAQEALGGTMYVEIGDYSYDKNGVLGNGVRNDTPGQTEDRSVLNGYNSNGYIGANNDGANGKKIIFVGGSITSDVTGYASIDNIGTSLLLAVPAYTNVTFEGTTFNNVMSFDYQLYTGPWSQLGELKFDNCKFDGLIVGAIAAQTLTFNGCEFKNYTNTTEANNSNPTWIRPAYGNWSKGDNEGQGSDFKSLTTINFTGNTVTSTRPVKFEYISQWDITSTVTATGNYFDITAQSGDTPIKNVGLYLGAHTDANEFHLVAADNTKSKNTAALYTIPSGKTSLPVDSTVKNTAGESIELTDALKWKATDAEKDKIVLKTVIAVASIGERRFATLEEAVAAVAKNGEEVTIKLLSNITAGGIDVAAGQNIVFDFDGHTYTLDGSMVGSTGTKTNGFRFLKGSTVVLKNGTLANGNGSPAKAMINSYATLKLVDFSVDARTTAVAETGSAYGYAALYISNGVTTVTGNGNYTTSDDNFVILIANVGDYTDGASLVFDENYTGTVSGKVSTGNKQNATVEIKNGKFDLKSIDVENTNTTVTISGGKFKNIEIAGKYLDNKAFDTEADADGYYAVMAHPITGIGLSIGEDISLRVIVRNGYQDGKLFYSYIDANGNLVEEKATIGKDTKGNYVFRIYNINPQRAGTIYTLRYEDKAGNTVGALKEASILTYLEGLYDKKIENETATKEAARKVYIANFLEYCAAAATRAYPDDESRTQAIRDLMNKLGLEVTHFTLDEDHAGETYNDNAEKVFTGLGIEYGSIMRIYYAVSEEAYNAGYVYKQAGHVISNPIEIVEGKNGKEYRLYLNIPPYEYFSGQTITVEDSEENTICVYSCPMGRILLRFSNTERYEEKVTSVARAAFDYCAALKAYLRSK